MPDPDTDERAQLRAEINRLIGEYAHELDSDFLATEWVIVVGMTKMDWEGGRQAIVTVHDSVPYSSRLGLLTSAQSDLLIPWEDDDDDD